MTTNPEEDQIPTYIFPTTSFQGQNQYDNPFENIEYEIGQIEVSGYDGVQNKGGKGKTQSKSNKSLKQIQKELAQRMKKYSIFSYDLMELTNGTIKKLYLLLYNCAYYSFSQYETFMLVENDPQLLVNCCQYILKLNEKLIQEENVYQISDTNSLIIMNQMKEIINKIQEELKDKKQAPGNEVMQKVKSKEKDISQKINIKEALKSEVKENAKDNCYESYNDQIEKIRVNSIIIEFSKLLLKICDFVEQQPKILTLFEDIIEKYLQKFTLNSSNSSEKIILFQYFKEIINNNNILDRFNLFKTQINSLNSLLKQVVISYGLDFKDDQELQKNKPKSLSIPRSVKSIVEAIGQDANNIDKHNLKALEVLKQIQ
ncbi:hypothetical protein ABPG74_022255 [Tetrahymena malaccensis]